MKKINENKGKYEQKSTLIVQNHDAIRREISSAFQRLIEDLKNREQCLLAEAEVGMAAQLRTNGLEKENAEVELSSVASFCDSTEETLNKQDEDHSNEISLINKQCKQFYEQIKNIDEQTSEIKKVLNHFI